MEEEQSSPNKEIERVRLHKSPPPVSALVHVPTPAHVLASRANGAKSSGPISIAGKRRAARNALKHGLLSTDIVVAGESAQRWRRFRNQTIMDLHPRNGAQVVLAEQIAFVMWRLKRLAKYESAVLGQRLIELERQVETSLPTGPIPPGPDQLTMIAAVPGDKGIERIIRYTTHLHRSLHRLLVSYRQL
jgi:hypothetical protein